jgi:putative ABC transport system permease protein
LRDAQKLQFELAPPAARRETARRGGTGSETNTVNAVLVRLQDGVAPQTFASEVVRWKHLAALTQAEQETVLSRSVVERARRQIGLFTGLLLVVSTVIIALIIYTLTLDKKKSIATLKLIGAPDRKIIGLIVQQALAMGVTGFFAGAALIHVIQDVFPRRLVLETFDAAALLSIVIAVCLVASGLGVRMALRIDPATALAG